MQTVYGKEFTEQQWTAKYVDSTSKNARPSSVQTEKSGKYHLGLIAIVRTYYTISNVYGVQIPTIQKHTQEKQKK